MKKTALILSIFLLIAGFCSCEGGEIFSGSVAITYKVEDGSATVVKVPDKSALTEIVIPDEYEGCPVTAIADFAAVNLEYVTKITIGKNVSDIALWAFENSSNITAFEVDDENPYFCDVDGVLFTKDMKTLLFYPLAKGITEEKNEKGETIKTASYTIPEGVEVIRTKAFYKCTSLRHIVLPSSVTSIEEKAFFRCPIDELILPEGLTFIGKDAFAYCEALKETVIPESVTEIGEYAFYNCRGLLDIKMEGEEEKMTLGNKWYPTDNGLEIAELSIVWANNK